MKLRREKPKNIKDFKHPLFKKLKQKLGRKTGSGILVFAGILMVFLAFYTFSANANKALAADSTGAQIFRPNNISVTVDTYINGSSSPDSFARIGLDSNASLTIREVIKLAGAQACTDDGTTCSQTAPATQIQFGKDKLRFDTSVSVISGSELMSLDGVTAGLLPQNGSTVNGGNYTCITDTVSTLFSTPFTYNTCSFLSKFRADSSGSASTVQVGGVILDKTFTINQQDLAYLNITQVKQGYIVYAYPGLFYGKGESAFTKFFGTNVINGGWDVIFPAGGKAVTIDAFTTQNQATVADQTLGRRSDVPGYGSTTSNAQGTENQNRGLLGLITDIITGIASLINQFIYFIFYWLIAPLIQAVLSIHVYTDQFVNVIYPGWEIVRNVCNILFIVAIIAMGMATLLRVESYQWRHILVQLVIAALLVNFSLIIGQTILALADTIQSQFLPNNVDVIRSLARDLMIANNATTLSQNTLGGNVSYVIQYLFFVAMAIGSFLVFAAIAVFLVIRIVALWVLLMLSPIAYVARILPATESAAKKWWDEFIKYAFFTPIIAFFLNMTAVISAATRNNPVLSQIQSSNYTNAGAFTGSNNQSLSQFVFTVASNILLLVFLVMAIKVADFMGVAGGKALSDIGEKGMRLPFTYTGGKISGKAKDVGERTKMAAETIRLNTANRLFSPNEGEGRTKSFLKRRAFNIASGGAYDKSKKEEREHHLHEAQENVQASAKDYRNFVHGEPMTAQQKLEAKRRNEEVKKVNDYIEDQDASDNSTNAVRALNSMHGEELEFEMQARINKALKEKHFTQFKDAVVGHANATVEEFYTALESHHIEGPALVRYRNMVNSQQTTNGQFGDVVDPRLRDAAGRPRVSGLTAADSETWRSERMLGKTGEEQAGIHQSMYSTTGVRGGTPTNFATNFVAHFTTEGQADAITVKLSSEKKAWLRDMLNAHEAALRAQMAAAPPAGLGMAAPAIDAAIDNLRNRV